MTRILPEDLNAYEMLGDAYEREGNRDLAIDTYNIGMHDE